jgi:hypothetical protein
VSIDDVSGSGEREFEVRRVRMPSTGVESWTLVGRDGQPVALVEEFLAWLTHVERSPKSYTQMLWMGLRTKAAYLPG